MGGIWKELDEDNNCRKCGLFEKCFYPKMPASGHGEKGILILGEAPGEEEDEKGAKLQAEEGIGPQFVGASGQQLRETVAAAGLDFEADFWKINCINCRPPGNRKPTQRELEFCWPRVQKVIKEKNPKAIWLVGGSALENILGHTEFTMAITSWRRKAVPYQGRWLIPLVHPSYIIRNRNDYTLEQYRRDVKWAYSASMCPVPPIPDLDSHVEKHLTFGPIIEFLDYIYRTQDLITFDYECTALKWQLPGQKILTIGVGYVDEEGKVKAASFPYLHPKSGLSRFQQTAIKKRWTRILKEEKIRKVAHNVKFEDGWSRNGFGVIPHGWEWCTMNSQHKLDESPKTTGLKFQSFVRWGVIYVDEEIKKHIGSEDEEKPVNKLDLIQPNKLCGYNAKDALLTFWLYKEQIKEFSRKDDLMRAARFTLDGVLALADCEQVGIPVNNEYYDKQRVKLNQQIIDISEELSSSEEWKLFKEKTNRDIDVDSTADMRMLLYDFLNIDVKKKTATGGNSVDAEVLEKIGIPFTKNIIRLRKLLKTKNTYLSQYDKVQINGRIYPVYNLHFARSHRSSSNDPNFQNVPIREPEAAEAVRGGIEADEGFMMGEKDYKAIEVCIAACYTRDPTLIDYIHHPENDMHKDQAVELFLLRPKEVHKNIRFHTKNGFVFPEFYGSYYRSCANTLWEESDHLVLADNETPLRLHLYDQGIRGYKDFEAHVKLCEKKFWRRFPVFREWQERQEDFYTRRGYIETFFGHRRGGYMTKNEIINTPIQATAFHCLLWSLIRANELRKEEGWKSKIPGQIHDSMVWFFWPEEFEYVDAAVDRIMTEDIRDEFSWLIVPLTVETELVPVGKSWFDKKPKEEVWSSRN